MIINDNKILLTVKLILTFESINITSLIINRPEFLNEEFGDFMKLLIKQNLSEACGSDIQSNLDIINP